MTISSEVQQRINDLFSVLRWTYSKTMEAPQSPTPGQQQVLAGLAIVNHVELTQIEDSLSDEDFDKYIEHGERVGSINVDTDKSEEASSPIHQVASAYA